LLLLIAAVFSLAVVSAHLSILLTVIHNYYTRFILFLLLSDGGDLVMGSVSDL
jgi:hypothetical protein